MPPFPSIANGPMRLPPLEGVTRLPPANSGSPAQERSTVDAPRFPSAGEAIAAGRLNTDADLQEHARGLKIKFEAAQRELELARADSAPLIQRCLAHDQKAGSGTVSKEESAQYWVDRACLYALDRYAQPRERYLNETREAQALIGRGVDSFTNARFQEASQCFEKAKVQEERAESRRWMLQQVPFPDEENKRLIAALFTEDNVNFARPECREEMLRLAASQDAARNRALGELVKQWHFPFLCSGFSRGTPPYAPPDVTLIKVFSATATDDLPHLLNLFRSRSIAAAPPLMQRDLLPQDNHTLLDHLGLLERRIREGGIDPELQVPVFSNRGNSYLDMFSRLIREIDQHGENIQGNRGVCPMAAFQEFLLETYPAEAVRLFSNLIRKTDGKEQPGVNLASGERLAPSPGSRPDDGSRRTPNERVMQSDLMDYANGPNVAYLNQRDQHCQSSIYAPGQVFEIGTGLRVKEVVRAVCGVLNQPAALYLADGRVQIYNPDLTCYAHEKQPSANPSATMTSAMWRHSSGLNFKPKLVMASVQFMEPESGDKATVHSFHATRVEQLKEENGKWRVYFRNPWGPDTPEPEAIKAKTKLEYRKEDKQGRCSSPLENFHQRTAWVLVTLAPEECRGEAQANNLRLGERPVSQGDL